MIPHLYTESTGSGDPVLLLHGGFCTLETMRPQAEVLAASFRVHAFERPGHGRTPDVDGAYSYAAEVTRTVAWLDRAGLTSVHVVGHSDGAVIGLLLAIHHPDRVRSLVAISANLHPSGFTYDADELQAAVAAAGESVQVTDDDEDARLHARLSPDGPGHAAVVLGKLRRMWLTQPDIAPQDLCRIAVPVLVVAADRDSIRPEHTRLIAASIPGARLAVVADATHAVLTEHPDTIGTLLLGFLLDVREVSRRLGPERPRPLAAPSGRHRHGRRR